MTESSGILKKLENVLKCLYINDINQDKAYRYAIRIALTIWIFLLMLVVFLFIANLFRFNLLSLSAIGICLSAMIASLMMWYNIETTKRAVIEKEEKAIQKEFYHFSELSFRTYRAAEEAYLQEPKTILAEDISMMLASMIEQYLNEYTKFSLIYSRFDKNQERWLREQMFGLAFDLVNIKRAIDKGSGHIAREYANGAYNDLRMIMVKVLKMPIEELDFAANQRKGIVK